jgi:hypothetical protein
MSDTTRGVLLLAFLLVAYGIAGRIDFDDEVRLKEHIDLVCSELGTTQARARDIPAVLAPMPARGKRDRSLRLRCAVERQPPARREESAS